MAIKKSQLYTSIWSACDELRGGMDASLYKDYVLTLLFMKYVSDKYAGKKGALIEIPPGGGFADMIAAKGKSNIGEQLNVITGALAKANGLEGVINQADFDDDEKLGKGQEKVDRLTKLVGIFQDSFDFSRNRAEGDDLLGDAYEYLMRHFATESGKSKGQFYTPAEVSRVIAKVVGVSGATSQRQTIYDPTCGSGSLLLRAADETTHKLTLYGQEKDIATRGLAVMNSFLHDHPTAEILQGNTITEPQFLDDDGNLKRHDYVVANPPFSDKAWTNGLTAAKYFGRFEAEESKDKGGRVTTSYVLPPNKNGDYAYLLHVLKSMKSTGRGCIVMPHGVLFRGGAEAAIRRSLIRQGVIEAIIGLPPNLFYGTGIPACLIVLDKASAATRTGIYMIDASKGFIKDGNKNRLRHRDIHQIVDAFTTKAPIDRYARLVPVAEIEKNDGNLNIPRYIDSTDPEDLQDIEGHLHGGIPQRDVDALADYWRTCPSLRRTLFAAERPGYLRLAIDEGAIRSTIFDHPEFVAFKKTVHDRIATWRTGAEPKLTAIKPGDHPKALVHRLSEDLLAAFTGAPLVDRYAIYEHLMVYWTDVMQDDVYILVVDGWLAGAKPREVVQVKNKDGKMTWPEDHDFTVGKRRFRSDLLPSALLIARYFAKEQAAIGALEAELADAGQQMDEMVEEHGGDEGALSEAVNEKGKITAKDFKAFWKKIEKDKDAAEEREIARKYLDLMTREADAKAALKDAREKLNDAVAKKYGTLTEPEIITLVVRDKWLARLAADVEGELDRVSQALTTRVRTLAQRYRQPLPMIVEEVETLSARVDEHLRKMGFAVHG